MAYRIYVDESGTHEGSDWLLIGMLFVPHHADIHRRLCKVKDEYSYFNTSEKHKARYRQLHFNAIKTDRDVSVANAWIDEFCASDAFFRAVAFEWRMWDGRYFGDAFEPDTLKKRRAYKKWCELVLQPELSSPLNGNRITGAEMFLDHLRLAYGYDVVDHLRERFEPPDSYRGSAPAITRIQHTRS
jgi:hypothetical protein